MMKFETPDGRLFTIRVEGYEFPNEDLGPTQDNPLDDFETGRFLVVSHTFRNIDGEWTASGATMTTNELKRLVDWLKSVSIGNPSRAGVYFTERDLEIGFDTASDSLQVHTFYRFLPKWTSPLGSVTIDFPLKQINLDLALVALNQMLNDFPGRPPLPTEH